MQRRMWLANNRAAVLDRLNWLNDQPDGLLHFEAAGSSCRIVTKAKSDIYLRHIETAKPDFSLVQSQLNLKQPFYLASRCKQAMVLSLAWQNNPSRVCLIGLGGGRIPLVLHHYLPEVTLDCVEIDPAMLAIAIKFFGLQPDDRLKVIIEDGQAHLSRSPQTYDIIFIDAFLASGRAPSHLTAKAFFSLCQNRLSSGGIITINLLESDPGYPDSLKAMQAVFDQVYVCSFLEGNRVIFAPQGLPPLTPAEVVEQARLIQNCHHFSFPFVKRATEVRTGFGLLAELDRALG